MLTNDLQQTWKEWISVADELVQKMHEQTVGITLRDLEKIHRVQPAVAAMFAELAHLESQADSLVKRIGDEMATGSDLNLLAQSLEKVEAQTLLGLANRVSAESRVIRNLLEKNCELMAQKLGSAASLDGRPEQGWQAMAA